MSYEHSLLPGCDRRHDTGALMSVASCLTDQDIDDIVTAYRKVARVILG
jgi:8-amino-3,8-dideoxy-alpha-D-manno-octulosonate transaminase